MFSLSELRNKDIVRESDGKKLGYPGDVELDLDKGCIRGVILHGESRLPGFFGRREETVLPWSKIRRIGVDVILVGENEEEEPLPLPEKTAPENSNSDWENWQL